MDLVIDLFTEKLPESISALAAVFGFIAIIVQLRASKRIVRMQFEDSINKEYRELISNIPAKALLGEGLNQKEYENTLDDFFRYFDLCNEQIFLHQSKRIDSKTWAQWEAGILFNLSLCAFRKAWIEINIKAPSQFSELSQLLMRNEKNFTADKS